MVTQEFDNLFFTGDHTCQLTRFRRVTPDFSTLHPIIFYDPGGHAFHPIFVEQPENLPISGFGS